MSNYADDDLVVFNRRSHRVYYGKGPCIPICCRFITDEQANDLNDYLSNLIGCHNWPKSDRIAATEGK